MEATLGIEPRNGGFADLCLTAWLCRHYYNLNGKFSPAVKISVERETRFELATSALARQRSTSEPFPHKIKLLAQHQQVQCEHFGGGYRARTYDRLLVRQMLSQLS